MKKIIFTLPMILFIYNLYPQDKSAFKVISRNYYQNVIMKDVREAENNTSAGIQVKRFKVDLSGLPLPNKVDLYKSQWHNQPVSQGNAGTCWAFSTISFYESEIFRITGQKIKLSEIYIAYWEYVEKAREFVRTRGVSLFEEGSEANAVVRMFGKYGAVPYEQYTGLTSGRKFHTHEKMKKEMTGYLKSVKESNQWNEEEVLSTIKSILNHYLGTPPSEFSFKGEKHSPVTFLKNVMKIIPEDYVDILSYMQEPYYNKVIYDVPDNWWKSTDYYNVPLDEFMKSLRQCIEKGYTVSIGGDVSEAGFDSETQCAVVPSFDIPKENITEEARQFRFSNFTTTDDHGVHLVGYCDFENNRWYLIKDSGAGSRNNDVNAKEFGYYFFREDFVRLKMMNFTVHKDAVKELLKKFK